MYRRKTYRRKAPKKTSKRKSYAPKRKAMPLRKMIRREIARNVENKTVQKYVYSVGLVGPADSGTFNTTNIIPLGPDPASLVINQGTGQGQRIGNQIKTKKLTIKGTIVPRQYDGTFNAPMLPYQVKVWIFYDRTDPTAVPAPLTNFFQNGNTTKGFQNDLVDLWSPVNTDRYRVLATKDFKLGFAGYTGTGNGTGVTIANQYFSNNDFKLNCNFNFDLTKHYPQMVKFDDGSTTPTTRGLFMMWTMAYANGGNMILGQTPVDLSYVQDYHFEDA